MPTITHLQIGSAIEAELAAKNELIENLNEEISRICKEKNTIKEKWERLLDLSGKEIVINSKNQTINKELLNMFEELNIITKVI